MQECVACHGKTGRGDGPKAPDLKVHPGDFSRPVTTRQSDGELFWKITRGRTPMPAYRSRLSNRERWMLVHFIRTLAQAEPPATAQTQTPPPATAAQVQPPQQQKTPEPPVTNNVPAVQVADKPAPGPQPVAEKASAPAGGFVSRAEYDQLKKELESIKALLNSKRQTNDTAFSSQPQTQETVEALEQEMEDLRNALETTATGTTRQLLSGFASANFTSRRHEDSAFSANFAPLFLWQLSDRILFEAELDFTLQGSDTELDLERAQISYILNDYVTVGAGKFLSPMNFLEDRLHQVGKLPDKPLAIRELLPESNVGLQLRGGVPLGPTKINYAVYAGNAPEVREDDPALLGTLDFDNFNNTDGHLAMGGRLGFFPIPALEIGYGFQFSGLGASESGVDAFLQSVDLNYVRDIDALKGTLNLLAQWAWSDVDSFLYDPASLQGIGPLTFDNARNGGYAQVAYRPTMVPNEIINRLEPVLRYEQFNDRHEPSGLDETRWTIGLNYWLLPSAVLKAAYQFGDRSDDQEVQALLFQFKIGF